MPGFNSDVALVQNPALGALLQWRLAVGYSDERPDLLGCPAPLTFLAAPMLLHAQSLATINGTRLGLRAFATKFSEGNGDNDILLALHERARNMRDLSRDSLRVAMATRLVHLDIEGGYVVPLIKTLPKSRTDEPTRLQARNAEKLGRWFAALTLLEVSTILRLRF